MTQTQDRDLSFAPTVNPRPRALTPGQIGLFNEQGYLKPFRIYDGPAVATNRAYFDFLLAEIQRQNDGRDSYAINGYQSRCRGIYDMVVNPAILDLVEDLIGPDIVCWGTHFFCKLPHDPKSVPWHQDASYWPFTPARTVTVWLAIDDADRENAAMEVIPGTHRRGHLAWKQTQQQAVLNQEIEAPEALGEPVVMELKAGEISLHADMLAHGSKPNGSNRRRCGLTMRYCPPTVRALNPGWSSNAVICRGSDPTGQWVHKPRPDGEEVSPQNKPKSIGAN